MLLVFEKLKLVTEAKIADLLEACDKLSRKLTSLSRSLYSRGA